MGWFWFLAWCSGLAARNNEDRSSQLNTEPPVYYYDTLSPVGKVFFMAPAWAPVVVSIGILAYCYAHSIGIWPFLNF